KGSAPAVAEVMAGRVEMMFDTEFVVAKHIESGRLKALAFAGSERSKVLPDVPTMDEAGLDGFVGGSWVGILAPNGTPESVMNTLTTGIRDVMSDPEVAEALRGQGLHFCNTSSPTEFGRLIEEDKIGSASWRA